MLVLLLLPPAAVLRAAEDHLAAQTLKQQDASACSTFKCPFYSTNKMNVVPMEPGASQLQCSGDCDDSCPASMGFALNQEEGRPTLEQEWGSEYLVDDCSGDADSKACCFRAAWASGVPGIMTIVYGPDGCSFYTKRARSQASAAVTLKSTEVTATRSHADDNSRADENVPASATRCLKTESTPTELLGYPAQLERGTDEAACCTMTLEADANGPSNNVRRGSLTMMSSPGLVNGVKLANKHYCVFGSHGKREDYGTCQIQRQVGLPSGTNSPPKRPRGYAFAFTTTGGVEMNVCLLEKAGSSEWLQLLEADRLVAKGKGPGKVGHTTKTAKKTDTPPPSFVIVRNPYTRFLSAYLDKVVQQMRGTSYNGNFESFAVQVCLGKLARLTGEKCKRCSKDLESILHDDHTAPQIEGCGLAEGSVYDLVLRIEEQPLWYEALITMVGLQKTVQMIERTVPGREPQLSNNASNCFYRPPGTECTDLFKSAKPKIYEGGRSSNTQQDKHSKGADEQLAEHYTPLAARAVTALFASDFVRFNYPKWDGKDAKRFDPLSGEMVAPQSVSEQIKELKSIVSKG